MVLQGRSINKSQLIGSTKIHGYVLPAKIMTSIFIDQNLLSVLFNMIYKGKSKRTDQCHPHTFIRLLMQLSKFYKLRSISSTNINQCVLLTIFIYSKSICCLSTQSKSINCFYSQHPCFVFTVEHVHKSLSCL